MNTLLWFIHFHKCAGTSLVDSLLEGGYRPAACHHNGNPVDASGRQIDFTNFDAHKMSSYIDTAIESGTTVICSEFSNPRMDWLKRDKRVKVVTILRHPISRMISNWKFDMINQYSCANQKLSAYIQQPYPWCSPGFYCESLAAMTEAESGGHPEQRHTKDTLKQALKTLEYFDAIAIQEDRNSMQNLASALELKTIKTSNKTHTHQAILNDLLRFRLSRSWQRLVVAMAEKLPVGRPLSTLSEADQGAFAQDLLIYNRAQELAISSSGRSFCPAVPQAA